MEREIQQEILEKWLGGQLSQAELNELEQHKEFKLYQTILEESQNLKIDSFNKEESFEKLWSKILEERKVVSINSVEKSQKKKNQWWLPLSAAASIAALALIATMFLKNDAILEASASTLVSKVAKENCEKLTLPDGSIVEMDKGAKVSYDTALFAENREVKITGDVFLNVKKGSSFHVVTEQANVGVLGTSFSVYNSYNGFQSFCSTGRVRVALPDNSQSVVLEPGMGVELADGGLKELVLNEPKPEPKTKGVYFSNKSLFEVFAELANYNKVKFKFTGDAGMRMYSGSLNPNDLDSCLRSVQKATNITWERKGNIIEIK